MKAEGMIDALLTQEKVQRIYNRLGGIYDLWGAAAESRARGEGIRRAQIVDGESVLDVATGTGLILAQVARLNPRGFSAGIDISAGMLKKARGKFDLSSGRIEIKTGSAFDIPYPDHTFDLVVNGYMFDLMPFEVMPKIITEFRRVLKTGGRALLINMTFKEGHGQKFYEWVYNIFPSSMAGCRGVQLTKPLEENGFKVISRDYYQQMLFPSEVILAKAS